MLFSNAFGDIWNIWQSNTAAAATWNVCRLHHGEKTMCYLNSKVTAISDGNPTNKLAAIKRHQIQHTVYHI
jgi:hypothetical protein